MRFYVFSTVFGLTFATLAVAGAPRADAETAVQTLLRTCPNRTAIASANQKAAEADAVESADRFELYRAVAREYFRCSETSASPRYRDLARLTYVAAMLGTVDFSSMTSASDVKDMIGRVRRWESTTNEVASTTRDPEAKKLALKLRGVLTKLARDADDQVARFAASSSQ